LRNALPLSAPEYEYLGIDPHLRPGELSPADYARISALIGSR